MVGGEEDEGQIDGNLADLHPYGVSEVAGGGFRIGLARESGRESKRGRSDRACGMGRHGMNMLPVGRRYVSRMLKKSASGVLASLRGSTFRSVRLTSSLAAALPAERRVLARRGWAGETSGLFEHPAWRASVIPDMQPVKFQCAHRVFPQPVRPLGPSAPGGP